MGLSNAPKVFLKVRSNKFFEFFVISVIIASALLVGVKTYEISPTLHKVTQYLDFFITVFFVFEISIRWLAEQNKKRFFHNFWNLFDTLIVAVSLIPIENTDMALIARLVRVFRVLRITQLPVFITTAVNTKYIAQCFNRISGFMALIEFFD